jgi:hypothetical protein
MRGLGGGGENESWRCSHHISVQGGAGATGTVEEGKHVAQYAPHFFYSIQHILPLCLVFIKFNINKYIILFYCMSLST